LDDILYPVKYLFLFALAIVFCTEAPAQKIRFTDTANHWTFLCISDPTPPYYVFTTAYAYDSSTIYNNIPYQAIGTVLVREDIANQKVYARFFMNNAAERVLYNYNLALNDTFRSQTNSGVPVYCTVTQLDSVTINSVQHRRWRFQCTDSTGNGYMPFTVVEGLGCIDGSVFYPLMPTAIEPTCALCAFRQNGNLLYGGTAGCKAGVADPHEEKKPLVTVGNPCSATGRMFFSKAAQKGTIGFYDVNGRLVHSMVVSGDYIIPGDYLFITGMYFYAFRSADGQTVNGIFLLQ
jgi:hypothetical protein